MLKSLRGLLSPLRLLDGRLQRIQAALGRIELRQLESANGDDFNERELSVFSQWGEDGLIQYLVSRVEIRERVFVEFGVENYLESNTRFLLINSGWRGLVIDGSEENIAYVRSDEIHWRYPLTAIQAFVTRDNINDLLRTNGIVGDIGLLSIDIDGNDYWVWEAIDAVCPRIVVVEYNSLWGPDAFVTIPYDPHFTRGQAHYSNLYYGASAAALEALGRRKGYTLIGSNRAGNNLFFVRNDVAGRLRPVTARTTWRASSFRESRDAEGGLTYLDADAARKAIAELPLVDIRDGRTYRVADLRT